MSRPRDSVNRTRHHLYIKGRPGRFRDKQQSTRRDTGKANPLPVNRRPSNTKPTRRRLLPSRRGRTSINPLCPLCAMNPFKLTRAMVPSSSPLNRTSAVLFPRQLAPTVGPAHDGFEFLKGGFEGLKGYAVGRMTKSRRSRIYIDDAGLRDPKIRKLIY